MKVLHSNPLNVGRQQTTGEIDYVKDGVLHQRENAPCVQITSETELPNLIQHYSPGAIAYTAGWKNAWQLSANGEWVSML